MTIWASRSEVFMHSDAALEAIRDVLTGVEPAEPDPAQAVVDAFGDETDIDARFEDIFAAAVAEGAVRAAGDPDRAFGLT
ncbi:hypothetical protein ES017_15015 [Anoxybacillus sp. EFIL]|nr:hypothetical protein [Anoxybacillus sp. EFIL]